MKSTGSPSSRRVLKRLDELLQGSDLLCSPLPTLDFDDFFRTRGVDYTGEEIKVARRVSWEEIRHSLPAQVGMLDVRILLRGVSCIIFRTSLSIWSLRMTWLLGGPQMS